MPAVIDCRWLAIITISTYTYSIVYLPVMPIQNRLNSDRLLAVFALLFVGSWLLMVQVVGAWTADTYSALIWVANVLVFGMVAIALLRLYSSDTTILGGTLAILAILHAPLFLGMSLGLVDLPTMQTFDVISRSTMYPLLGILGVGVLLRPLLPLNQPTSSSQRPA